MAGCLCGRGVGGEGKVGLGGWEWGGRGLPVTEATVTVVRVKLVDTLSAVETNAAADSRLAVINVHIADFTRPSCLAVADKSVDLITTVLHSRAMT